MTKVAQLLGVTTPETIPTCRCRDRPTMPLLGPSDHAAVRVLGECRIGRRSKDLGLALASSSQTGWAACRGPVTH